LDVVDDDRRDIEIIIEAIQEGEGLRAQNLDQKREGGLGQS